MNATYNTIDRLVADRRHAFEAAADRHRLVTTAHRSRLLSLLPTRLVPRADRAGASDGCESLTTAAA